MFWDGFWTFLVKEINSTRLGKTGFSWKTWFFDPILQLRGFWQDRSVRKNGAQLYGPWVSNFLSHRIVKSLTFRIVNWNFNVLEMALKTLHFVQGLSRTPSLVFPRYLTTRFSKMILQKSTKSRESKIWKSEISKNPGYCPGGTKRRMQLTVPSGQKT
jgi:hypothetical protein